MSEKPKDPAETSAPSKSAEHETEPANPNKPVAPERQDEGQQVA